MKSLLIVIMAILVVFAGKHILLRYDASKTRAHAPITAYVPVPNIDEGPLISFNFDDGFTSVFNDALPILDKVGFKATHYVIANMVGEPSYMDLKQILALQDKGHEIGAHTLTHANLVEIPIQEAQKEITGSKKALFNMGVARIETFSYPNGVFNEDIKNLVKEAGFSGARITNPGLNDETTDPYKLFYFGINSELNFDEIKQKIDEAIESKKWLILVFHRVGESGYENVSKSLFQKIVDYVEEKQIPVVTTSQGLFILRNINH